MYLRFSSPWLLSLDYHLLSLDLFTSHYPAIFSRARTYLSYLCNNTIGTEFGISDSLLSQKNQPCTLEEKKREEAACNDPLLDTFHDTQTYHEIW